MNSGVGILRHQRFASERAPAGCTTSTRATLLAKAAAPGVTSLALGEEPSSRRARSGAVSGKRTFRNAVPGRVDPTGPFDAQRRICPRRVYVRTDPRLLGELLELAANGLEVPVAHRVALADAARAHELVAAGGLRGKVVLDL
jgi:Zinc-binding dehydrogenase